MGAADDSIAVKGGPLAVAFSATSYAIAEEDGSATVTVQLTEAGRKTITVDYATSPGTATADVDYVSTSGTLTYAPGETSQTFEVVIVDDPDAEPDETVILTLSNPSNVTLGSPSTATLTILNVADGGPPPQPSALIIAPEDGATYNGGDEITMDGSTSTVPDGYQSWFGALVDGSGDPMDLAFSTASLQGSFTASADDSAYVIRLVIADPGSMPSDSELRGGSLPCVDQATCDSSEIVISRAASGGDHPGFELVHAFPEVVMLRWGATVDAFLFAVHRSTDAVTWDPNPLPGSPPTGNYHLEMP